MRKMVDQARQLLGQVQGAAAVPQKPEPQVVTGISMRMHLVITACAPTRSEARPKVAQAAGTPYLECGKHEEAAGRYAACWASQQRRVQAPARPAQVHKLDLGL